MKFPFGKCLRVIEKRKLIWYYMGNDSYWGSFGVPLFG